MILIVEDDPQVARLISLVLQRNGEKSEVVSDGRAALERAKELNPSLIFAKIPELNERVLRQTSESVVNTYTARTLQQKALSVLQTTTVFHCLVCETDQPYSEVLDVYVMRSGGATFIPVVMVPEINQV